MSEANSTNDVARGPDGLDEASAYAALSRIVLPGRPMQEILEEVAGLAKRVLPEAPEVSVTLMEDDRAHTAAFTGVVAIELDERQYAKGFGPCLDAAVSGSKINLTMDDPDPAYPDFCQLGQRFGVTHSLSVGIPVSTPTVGALNLYNSTGRAFSSEAGRIADTFASFAGIVLATAGLHRDLADLTAQLQSAVRSRAVIDQAKGIIMAQNRCSGEEAFQLLVRASQHRNLKLRLLAEQLVSSVTRPPNADGSRTGAPT
jgi:GAF domain-containing protein